MFMSHSFGHNLLVGLSGKTKLVILLSEEFYYKYNFHLKYQVVIMAVRSYLRKWSIKCKEI
jgi:hypothetical protein